MRLLAGQTLFAATAFWLSRTEAYLHGTGKITLFSDTACEDNVYSNAFRLGPDVCGSENSATPYLDPFRSFLLHERPWCDNGSRPYFNLYGDTSCNELIRSLPARALYQPSGPDADGTCVAPGDFKGMAFICDGVEGSVNGGWGDGTTASTGTDGSSTTGSTSVVTSDLTTDLMAATTTRSSSLMSPTTPSSAPTTASSTTSETVLATGTASSAPTGGNASTTAIPTAGAESSTTTLGSILAALLGSLVLGSML
ncbi:hypothetical protein F5Y15DRAFT_304648 [Xylariaceae sp. FL0016]|nr:hypothetical protein F5Y15DRAFT_304648 [Xylariaceae sp. FL0016]